MRGGSDISARKARFLLHLAAWKEDIEAEEIETDHRLLERAPDRLGMKKGEHYLVARASGKAEIESARIGPARMPGIETHLDPRAAKRDRRRANSLHLTGLRGKYVRLVIRPHRVDPRQARGSEHIIGVHGDDEGGEQ